MPPNGCCCCDRGPFRCCCCCCGRPGSEAAPAAGPDGASRSPPCEAVMASILRWKASCWAVEDCCWPPPPLLPSRERSDPGEPPPTAVDDDDSPPARSSIDLGALGADSRSLARPAPDTRRLSAPAGPRRSSSAPRLRERGPAADRGPVGGAPEEERARVKRLPGGPWAEGRLRDEPAMASPAGVLGEGASATAAGGAGVGSSMAAAGSSSPAAVRKSQSVKDGSERVEGRQVRQSAALETSSPARPRPVHTKAVADEVKQLVRDHLFRLCVGEHDGDVLARGRAPRG
jgi:hypothetical protein